MGPAEQIFFLKNNEKGGKEMTGETRRDGCISKFLLSIFIYLKIKNKKPKIRKS